MLVLAVKLHASSHASRALRVHNHIQRRSLQTLSKTILYSNASTTTAAAAASSSNSSNFGEPHSSIAMSKGELESCQWLKHSEKSSPIESSHHRAPSPSPDCCFSAVGGSGSSPNRHVQSSIGPSVQPSSGSSSQPHSSPSKHSSILLSALPASRLLDAAFSPAWTQAAENSIERAIFDFRFLSLLAVVGSLAGSFLCFLKGCVFIVESYAAFYAMCLKGEHTGKMVLRLVEAVDVYLTGTVMLIFGMGLYGLFISNVATNLPPREDRALKNSSLFGMFLLQERPKWMRIASLDELKTKLGHVVVMILLVKMFERSKAVTIITGADLLSYSVSIFLTSAALLVLRHLQH